MIFNVEDFSEYDGFIDYNYLLVTVKNINLAIYILLYCQIFVEKNFSSIHWSIYVILLAEWV